MSAQRLSPKKTRRLVRKTGLPIVRAWAHGGYVYDFVTAGHLHGWFDIRTDTWGLEKDQNFYHYDTCSPERPTAGDEPLFPNGPAELTEEERNAQNKLL